MSTKPGVRRRDINNHRRKISYETFQDARKAARLVRQLINEVVLAYPCPLPRNQFAPHFHIGHPDLMLSLTENDARKPKRKKRNG